MVLDPDRPGTLSRASSSEFMSENRWQLTLLALPQLGPGRKTHAIPASVFWVWGFADLESKPQTWE